jgi:hypothetical protein
MKQILSVTAIALFVVAAAPAQETKPLGLSVRVGAHFPTYSLNNVSKDTGLAYGLSYNFLKLDKYRIEGEYFGSTHRASAFGNRRNVNNWAFSGVAYYDVPMQPYYVGLGLGFGKSSVNLPGVNVSNDTQFVYTLIGGYNFNKSVFAEVRYQGSSAETLRGITVLAGYRF